MTHVVLGYPSMEESMAIVRQMAQSGAHIIEVQIPFSDPMADGPSIMRANEEALAQGITPEACMRAIAKLSAELDTPLLCMSYCNVLFTYKGEGLRSFCQEAAAAGVSGLIVPDVPLEENREGYWTVSKEYGLVPISLVSPVTDEKRMKLIASQAEGFLYCVATTGTTGARADLAEQLPEYLQRVRAHSSVPLAVGFGISTAAQVATLKGNAEIAIVGSAMIDRIAASAKDQRLSAVAEFTAELSGSTPLAECVR